MPRKPNTPENKTHHCSFCDKSFRSGYELKVHMVMHTGERNFICSDCKKSFLRADGLRKHMLTHSDLRNFSCSQCDKAFKVADALKKHQRQVHEKIKLFKCPTCGKEFAKKAHLQQHLVTHSGIKNHKCSRCGLLFAQPSSLKRHQQNTCKSDSVIIANTHVSPGGKVTTSTTHTMVISPHLVTVVARSPEAMVTTQKHLGATVATVEQERPQQQHPEAVISPEADRLLDDIDKMINDDPGAVISPEEDRLLNEIDEMINNDSAGSPVGSQSGLLNNTNPTTLIFFNEGDPGYDIDLGWTFDGILDGPD